MAVETGNGNPTGNVVCKGVDGVVHDDGSAQVPAQTVEVFDVGAVGKLEAVLSVQTVGEVHSLGVE